jgi:hypothetical protein
MGLTRREFLELVGASIFGGLVSLGLYSVLNKPSEVPEIVYEGNKTVTTTET